MGTEIRTFTTLKDITDYINDQLGQHKALFEDYSQWLGTLLRDCEANHKNEDWYQKTAAMQKNTKAPPKKAPEKKPSGGKGKKTESSIWIPSGNILLASTEQGRAEVLFEAIEKIGEKIGELDKLKASIQQLERIGLGKNVNYILYIEEDVPKKIVVQPKGNSSDDGGFKYATEMSIQAYYNDTVVAKETVK
jgi:hypothetical protein